MSRNGRSIDGITFGVRNRSRGIAGRIGGDERRIDGAIGIGREITTCDINTKTAIGEDATGGVDTIDGEGNDITGLEISCDVTGHGNGATGFNGIDDVIGRDVRVKCDGRSRGRIDGVSLRCP